MNRLRKPRISEPSTMTPAMADASNTSAMSRTMQLAVRGIASTRGNDSSGVSTNLQRRGTWFSAPLAAAPRTKVEQYWAARALVAETLLSARDRHQAELAEMQRTGEQKREQEIGAILHANDRRQSRLERLMVVCLMMLLGFTAWLVVKITPDRNAKSASSKPSHFTIPILSPFTSVVEHEMGVFGTKAVVIFVLVIGIAAYAAMRHLIAQWRGR